MNYKFSPSIMCSKPWDMLTYIRQFEKTDIDMIHYDVMDGNFVPNIMLGTEQYKAIHEVTNLSIDLHLMCQNPDVAINYFDIKKNDRVCFHPQTVSASFSLLKKIKEMGAVAGLAFNPGVPINYIEEHLPYLDFVLIMSVEPGFAGQALLPNAMDKIKRVYDFKINNNLNYDIVVDGNCTSKNVKNMLKMGANQFVVGSALLNNNIEASNFANAYYNYKNEIGI